MALLPPAQTAELVEFACHLSDAAAAEILPLFRAGLTVENKGAEDYDPVTEADRAAEDAIRTLIARRFPDHGIFGEEYGRSEGSAPFVWVIDPIDGTRAFVCGLPVWSTLIGLLHEGRPVIGVMNQPFVGERFVAGPEQAYMETARGRTELVARATDTLSAAIVSTTTSDLYTAPRQAAALSALRHKTRMIRYGTDAYAYALLAAGHIDIALDVAMAPYDIVALIPLIERAGGVVTTWDGEPADQGGDIVASASPTLHAQVLEVLKGQS